MNMEFSLNDPAFLDFMFEADDKSVKVFRKNAKSGEKKITYITKKSLADDKGKEYEPFKATNPKHAAAEKGSAQPVAKPAAAKPVAIKPAPSAKPIAKVASKPVVQAVEKPKKSMVGSSKENSIPSKIKNNVATSFSKILPDGSSSHVPKMEPQAVVDSLDYSTKGEALTGLFLKEGKYIELKGVLDVHSSKHKDLMVRTNVDPKTHKILDAADPKQRERLVQVYDERLKLLSKKINAASAVLAGDEKAIAAYEKRLGRSLTSKDNSAMLKWMGEIGELYSYNELLRQGNVAYMLTDSARKNDMLVFSDCGGREAAVLQLSAKTSKDERVNQMGASSKGDIAVALDEADIPSIKIGGKEVGSKDTIAMVMDVRDKMMRKMTEGKMGRDGVHLSGGKVVDKDLYIKKTKLDAANIKKIISEMKETTQLDNDEDVDPQTTEILRKHLQNDLIKRSQSKEGFTLDNLNNWLVEMTGKVLEETKATTYATTDTIAIKFGKDGIEHTNIITAEEQNDAIQRKYGDPQKMSGMDQVLKVIGLSPRYRVMGDKNNNTGYLSALQHAVPTAQGDAISLGKYKEKINEYCKLSKAK
jgi:hypothetical protein